MSGAHERKDGPAPPGLQASLRVPEQAWSPYTGAWHSPGESTEQVELGGFLLLAHHSAPHCSRLASSRPSLLSQL